MVIYTARHIIRMFGSSHGLALTAPLNAMGVNLGDVVEIVVDDNKKMIIKKVKI